MKHCRLPIFDSSKKPQTAKFRRVAKMAILAINCIPAKKDHFLSEVYLKGWFS